jgi:predicted metal-binding membrane protein
MGSGLTAALARPRAISITGLLALIVLAWAWLIAGAGTGMEASFSLSPLAGQEPTAAGGAMAGMMQPAAVWSPARFGVTFAMWWIMMVAMMLPSSAPTILLYERAAGHGVNRSKAATESFLAGYLVAWGLFSLAATSLQFALEWAGVVSPAQMALHSRGLAAAVLVAAGVYQLSPLKNVCLRHCRSPARFLARHYRSGSAGALRMGVIHGAYCVGCCWLLMALLFVAGIMNLAWIALLTLVVALEKLLPGGRRVTTAAGIVCLAGGGAILLLG